MTSASDLTLLEAAALLSGASEWDSRALPAKGIPSFVMSDGPHGIRRQLGSGDHLGIAASEPATCFPTAATVANSWDPNLCEEMGSALGYEARTLGVDVVLGPGLNIKRSPLCGRNFEYYSEDPLLAGKMAAGLVRGIQSHGVAATPKHYAVNSQELRRMASDSIIDERTLREIYLTAFEIVVKEASPRALMSSYNKVNGTYAHENAHLLIEILRKEWGFNGMVVSDWGGSNSAVDAVSGGGSLEMPAPGLSGARDIVEAVSRGELAEEDVRARAQEVLNIAYLAHSHGSRPAPRTEVHHDLARQVARESAVLLRNDGTLPLAAGTRVAIIGDMATTPRYQGSGSSQVNPTKVESLRESIEGSGLQMVGYAQGYERFGAANQALIDEAVVLAKKADALVLAIGLDELSESEGMDRAHLRLPQVQIDLLNALRATGVPLIGVLSTGAPIETSWDGHCNALLHMCLSGQAGGAAAWDIVSGAANPSGHLAETWPLALDDHPTADIFPATGRYALYREGPYVGYRYFTTAGKKVAYPFGWGLSYSSFEFSDLRIDEGGAHVRIHNTSEREGADVIQLYVTPPGAVWGPTRVLRAFTKVTVPAGDEKDVTLPFDDYTFRHFDTATGTWLREKGEWTIAVGHHCNDLPLSGTLTIEGDTIAANPDIPEVYRTGQVRSVKDADFAILLGRHIPQEDASRALQADDPLSAMSRAKNPLARLAARFIDSRRRAAEKRGKPDLNILFVQNMPFRAIGKMTHGAVPPAAVEGIVDLVNGHFWKGASRVIGIVWKARRLDRNTQRILDGLSSDIPLSKTQ
ncbi:MAG: glycoside hydrolase family 3 C-terminal domain-containing protein [Actinomycetaceae bacterium]|nr:glycoside hydrolase family 3 C-terminal domain-containing protein [Actinomycetaceae bacterium]